MSVRNKLYRTLNPEAYLWTTAKARAKKTGREFTIKRSDVVIPAVCPILGIPLVVSPGSGRRKDSPSLDRVDNSRGYTKDNIRVISSWANTLKSNGTVEIFQRLIDYLEGRI
jgi:hypothetical protein